MSITRSIIAIAFVALTSASCTNSNAHDAANGRAAGTAPALVNADQAFVEQAAASGEREVEHAKLAQTNASSAAVKEYAARLMADHSAANQQLASLMQRRPSPQGERPQRDGRGSIGAKDDATTSTKTGASITGTANPTGTTGASGTVATTGEAKDRERAGMTHPWMQATGASFDEGYLSEQIKMHQEAIALFDQQSNSGTDPELKAFAAAQLPTLREHLRQAEALQRAMRQNP